MSETNVADAVSWLKSVMERRVGRIFVVGYGRASKEQVELMVGQMLGVKAANQHAADALAVGMCHFFHSRLASLS